MIVVDDLLLAPLKGVLWILRKVHDVAQEDLANESESITAELSSLYMRLETGKISEAEFAAEEKILLDRLDRAQASGGDEYEDEEEEEEPADGDEDQSVETGAAARGSTAGAS